MLYKLANLVLQISYLHKTSYYYSIEAFLLRFKLFKSTKKINESFITNKIPSTSNFSNLVTAPLIAMTAFTALRVLYVFLRHQNHAVYETETDDPNSAGNSFYNSIPNFPAKLSVGLGCLVPPVSRYSKTNSSSENPVICSICRRQCTDPCVSTGGYLFCYLCLIDHLNQFQKCPVTGLYCSVADIVKIIV